MNAPLQLASAHAAAPNPHNQLDHSPFSGHQVLAELALRFTRDELTNYTEQRKFGLTKYSMDWIERASRIFWKHTKGIISKQTMDALRLFALTHFHCVPSNVKVLGFAKSFLKYLTKNRLDTRYYAFELFLDRHRSVKENKRITSRIVVKADIEHVLRYIKIAELSGAISTERAQNYTAFVVLGAYTGQ